MLRSSERGCLAIADISGYTGYLTGSEIDHAQDVLADLMETVIGAMSPTLRLAKLEGDAIFTFAPEAEIDGSLLMDTIEGSYFAFRRRLQSIRRATTCECNACRTIPNLNLKFIVHHGGFIRQRIAGQEELAGSDVILVHRLLKNTVAEAFGSHAYALLTQACLQAMGIDPAPLGLVAHRESYEHFEDVPVYIQDLEARWKQEQETRRVLVAPEDAHLQAGHTFQAPLQMIWEWMTDAARRTQWVPHVSQVDVATVGGRRGVGTTNHCVHGKEAQLEEIIDWRPFEYLTYLVKDPQFGEALQTETFQPQDGGTRYDWRMQFTTPEVLAMMQNPEMATTMQAQADEAIQMFTDGFVRLEELLVSELAERRASLDAAEQARAKLQEQAAAHRGAREVAAQAGA